MIPRVLPVGLVTSYIRELLDSDDLLADLWVEGEVSNLFAARSGHVYFTLRGDDGQLKCAMFRSHAMRQRVLPRDGDQIAAHGQVTLYERDGEIQLYVDVVESAGLGLAALQIERLRQQLAAEGLFDEARKRPLPVAPQVIGVVTSPDGAVWHDIQHVLKRRYPLTHLVLSPTSVQGERAPSALVAALEALQADGRAEVIIVARGGGSAEDLAAFNDEAVVRAVFACRVPVVSGVGHETDWTLIDEVADLRAPTPSAAAEVCVPSIQDYAIRREEVEQRLQTAVGVASQSCRIHLSQSVRRLNQGSPMPKITTQREFVRGRLEQGARRQRSYLDMIHARLLAHRSLLQTLNPEAVLARGYAVLADTTTGAPVSRVTETAPGAHIRASLADGVLIGKVEEIQPARRKQSEAGA